MIRTAVPVRQTTYEKRKGRIFLKRLLIILSVFITLALTTVSAYAAVVGEGTESSPYIITNPEELLLIGDYPESHFALDDDITIDGRWTSLCTYPSSFTGVLDGRGHTISYIPLGTYSYHSLFGTNSGAIRNLNIVTKENVYFHSTQYGSNSAALGLIACENKGEISDCSVKGKIIVSNKELLVGSAVGINRGSISRVSADMTIAADYSYTLYTGGIVGENTKDALVSSCTAKGTFSKLSGGIAYSNSGTISNSYFIGTADAGISYSHTGKTENCYAAIVGENSDHTTSVGGTVTNSFYDKSIIGVGIGNGTGKTTLAMKMKRTYTDAGWDFGTVWGIDTNEVINDGYPYLLWEHPNIKSPERYTSSSIKFKSSAGAEISEIPQSSFYVEATAVKNDSSKTADTLIIAAYDENNAVLDMKFMSGAFYQNQSVSFGAFMSNTDKRIKCIKVFVWDSINGMLPLSESVTK